MIFYGQRILCRKTLKYPVTKQAWTTFHLSIGENSRQVSFPLDFAFQWYRLISRKREEKDEDTETGIDI